MFRFRFVKLGPAINDEREQASLFGLEMKKELASIVVALGVLAGHKPLPVSLPPLISDGPGSSSSSRQ